MTDNWKVKKGDGKIYGPADTEKMKKWITENRVSADDSISPAQMENWQPVRTNSLFAPLFTTAPQPENRPSEGLFTTTEKKNLGMAFQHKEYLFRRKVFTFLGAAFHVYDENRNVVFYSRQKPFRLREDFRVYAEETMNQELLVIKTPQILDIWATYNVEDPATGEKVGSIKRKALKSIIRDEWVLSSSDGREIGKLIEKSLLGALASRWLSNLIPQRYVIVAGEQEVAEIKQHFNPFILRYTMHIIAQQSVIDTRLLIAAGILLAGVERRQK